MSQNNVTRGERRFRLPAKSMASRYTADVLIGRSVQAEDYALRRWMDTAVKSVERCDVCGLIPDSTVSHKRGNPGGDECPTDQSRDPAETVTCCSLGRGVDIWLEEDRAGK